MRVGRPKKYGEDLVPVTVKIPRSVKQHLEELFPGQMSEFVRKAIEEKLARYEGHLEEILQREKEELMRRIEEIETILNGIKYDGFEVTEEEKRAILERFSGIKRDRNVLMTVLRVFAQDFDLDIVTAKRKVISVLPELEDVFEGRVSGGDSLPVRIRGYEVYSE